MKIYFAGSIRGGREDRDLYAEIIGMLKKYGEVLTEHIADKNITHMGQIEMTAEEIYNKDMAWLKEADIVIAEVTQVSLGVGYEIGHAENLDKKIICLYRPNPARSLSAMISGNPNCQVINYQNIEELKEILPTLLG